MTAVSGSIRRVVALFWLGTAPCIALEAPSHATFASNSCCVASKICTLLPCALQRSLSCRPVEVAWRGGPGVDRPAKARSISLQWHVQHNFNTLHCTAQADMSQTAVTAVLQGRLRGAGAGADHPADAAAAGVPAQRLAAAGGAAQAATGWAGEAAAAFPCHLKGKGQNMCMQLPCCRGS